MSTSEKSRERTAPEKARSADARTSSAARPGAANAPPASSSPFGVHSLEELVAKLASLDSFKKAVMDAAGSGSGGIGGGNAAETKKALGEVVTSALFDSGILEKMIVKQIERRGGQSGSDAQVHAKVKELLSGEEMKILLDDKFRAISLYLKGEVVPKAVKKALSEAGVTTV